MDHFLKLGGKHTRWLGTRSSLCRCQAVLRCVLQKHPRYISGRTHTCDVSQETNCCLKAVLKSRGAARKLVPTDSGRDFPRTNDPVDEGISKGKWEKTWKNISKSRCRISKHCAHVRHTGSIPLSDGLIEGQSKVEHLTWSSQSRAKSPHGPHGSSKIIQNYPKYVIIQARF